MAVWAKLPTLPAVAVPFLYLLSERRSREGFLYLFVLLAVLLSSFLIFSLAYGWSDISYILFEFVDSSKWSVRNHLFNGENAILKSMNYIEAAPLLLRFLVMYISKYWFILLLVLLCFFISFRITDNSRHILRTACIMYFLTLPSGLAALAHFGSVENALLFANGSGLLVLFFAIIILVYSNQEWAFLKLALIASVVLFSLPFLRVATSLPSTTDGSPHQQAFEYLKNGKDDVFFGWYPISHLLHSGKSYSCIEVPTWVGMNKPEAITYSRSHMPEGTKYLATCHVGYGSYVLQRYLGPLKEVSSPNELSAWRIFKLSE